MDEYIIKRITKSGGSLSVTLPKEYIEQLALKEGRYLKVYIQDGKLIMEKIR